MNISEVIVLARKRAGILQSDLAKECGFTRVSTNRYEKGGIEISPERKVKICQVLKIDPQEMVQAIKEEEKKKGVELGEKKAKEFMDAYYED
jgi:transcriptional regulator with XRE-family HTH domain